MTTLLDALADLGLDRLAIERATRDAHRMGVTQLQALVRAGVPVGAIQSACWTILGYEIIDLSPATIAPSVLRSVPLEICRQARAVACGRDGTTLTVAVADPSDVDATDAVRRAIAPLDVRLVVAPGETIDEVLRRYETAQIIGDAEAKAAPEARRTTSLTDQDGADSHAARHVAAIITYGVQANASDIHVCCSDDGADVRVRIDGVLHHHSALPGREAAGALVSRIKVLGGLDLGQRRLPQDGRIQVEVGGRVVDIRLATIPNVWDAEDAVLRILDTSAGHVRLGELGMSSPALAAWEHLWSAPYGLVLVAGPTGCGKSTTLYATLRELATPDRAIRTVEDPVEVRLPGVTQVQVNPRAGLTFASALRSFLRSDPDTILVGEIRDHETARVATEAAVTGHLVLATVHTSSAAQVPVRLIEMGVPTYLVSAALRGALTQRLVRRLCAHCKVGRDATEWPAIDAPDGVWDAHPGGCARCAHTGYRGRFAAAEVLLVDEATHRAIAGGGAVDEVLPAALAAGMTPLRTAILGAVRIGDTSLAELGRVTSAD